MLLCACPGWTAIGIGFAAVSFIGRKGAFRWPTVALIAAIGFTGVQWSLKDKEAVRDERVKAAAAKAAQKHAALGIQTTNNPLPATTPK